MVPGSAFGASGAGHVRACYATAYEELVEAMDRIERFVDRRGSRRPIHEAGHLRRDRLVHRASERPAPADSLRGLPARRRGAHHAGRMHARARRRRRLGTPAAAGHDRVPDAPAAVLTHGSLGRADGHLRAGRAPRSCSTWERPRSGPATCRSMRWSHRPPGGKAWTSSSRRTSRALDRAAHPRRLSHLRRGCRRVRGHHGGLAGAGCGRSGAPRPPRDGGAGARHRNGDRHRGGAGDR